MQMSRSKKVALLVGAMGLAVSACDSDRMATWRQADADRWNEFWGVEDSSGSLFGRRSGGTEVWTIECNAYKGSRRREMADRMATALKGVGDLRSEGVWVEHGEEQSRVFYGEYKLKYFEAKVDRESQRKGDFVIRLNERIKHDLRYIKTLAMGDQHPFFSARVIPKPLEDVGPPEWNLRNARGAYTLQVGVTYNTKTLHNYKKAAVEWVEVLRADGHEAYYYHNPEEPRSSICVGTFGAGALLESADGRTDYSGAVKALRGTGDFRYNLENGHRIRKLARDSDTGKVERMPNWSFLVKIPQPDSQGDG